MMRNRTPWLAFVLVLAACQGEQATAAIDQGALDKLVTCQGERDRHKAAGELCQKQLGEAQAQSAGNQVTVRLEGDILRVYGDLRGANLSAPDATKLSDAMINAVRSSRTAIQQCYVGALKQDTSIQARTINGRITLTVGKDGGVKAASFSPRISDTFAGCIDKIARRWKIPAHSTDSTFEVPMTLQPTE